MFHRRSLVQIVVPLLFLVIVVLEARRVPKKLDHVQQRLFAARALVESGQFAAAAASLRPVAAGHDEAVNLLGACDAINLNENSSGTATADAARMALDRGSPGISFQLAKIAAKMGQNDPTALFIVAGVLKELWALEEMHEVLERRGRLTRGKPATKLAIPP